jgi:hypothetical protein
MLARTTFSKTILFLLSLFVTYIPYLVVDEAGVLHQLRMLTSHPKELEVKWYVHTLREFLLVRFRGSRES